MSIIIHSQSGNIQLEIEHYSLIWPSSVDIEERITGKILGLTKEKLFKIEYDGDTQYFKVKDVRDRGTDEEIVYFIAPNKD